MEDLEHARRVVNRAMDHPLGRLHDRGYLYLWSRHVPALEQLETRRAARDGKLIADGYDALGDIYDINRAPLAAARAYRKAARLNPALACAWREWGCMLQDTGNFASAVRALRKAVRLDPGDERARDHLEYSEADLKRPTTALYRDGGIHYIGKTIPAPAWTVYELLATGQPEKVLALLEKKRSNMARQLRALAFGALRDTAGQLREWEAVANGRGPVELCYLNWFVMTRPVANSPRFWRALHALGRRLRGMGPVPNGGVWDAVPDPLRARLNSAAEAERTCRRGRLIVRYHIARTERDQAAARKLVQRYPEWKGARRLVESLAR